MAITSNVSSVIRIRLKQIEGLQADQVARACATAVLPEMRQRIHVQGKDSSGSQIGTYSNAYMKIRTGSFSNSDKISRGKNEGKNKNAGVFVKGGSTGKARPRFNRSSDTKVILSLTRQMENDMSVLAAGASYGIGYNNPLNYQKSQWCEQTYRKPIFRLTEGEKEIVRTVALEFVEQLQKS